MSDLVERPKGPIELLCKEIGYQFDRSLERKSLFVAFVAVLVSEVSDEREMQARIAHATGKPPSDGSATLLKSVTELLALTDYEEMRIACAQAHDLAHELNPDDAYPTDHLIDMLSGCVSAIRFGLEEPCRSRHAADAANHIWSRIYGVRRFDNFTPGWQHEWSRAQFQAALRSEAAAEIQRLRAELSSRAFRPIDDAARNGEPWLLCNRRTGDRVVAWFDPGAERNSSSWWASSIRYGADWPTHYAPLPPLSEETR